MTHESHESHKPFFSKDSVSKTMMCPKHKYKRINPHFLQVEASNSGVPLPENLKKIRAYS